MSRHSGLDKGRVRRNRHVAFGTKPAPGLTHTFCSSSLSPRRPGHPSPHSGGVGESIHDLAGFDMFDRSDDYKEPATGLHSAAGAPLAMTGPCNLCL
jgi:hypothetical protein